MVVIPYTEASSFPYGEQRHQLRYVNNQSNGSKDVINDKALYEVGFSSSI